MAAEGPRPLAPIGLVLHHDGRWTHEGQPIRHRRMREHFDRSVEYLPEERRHIVSLGRFRAQIEVEEAGFFVRGVDLARGRVRLASGREEALDVSSLTLSAIDGALLCRVYGDRVPGGLLARFSHAAHSELLGAVCEREGRYQLWVAGAWEALPPL